MTNEMSRRHLSLFLDFDFFRVLQSYLKKKSFYVKNEFLKQCLRLNGFYGTPWTLMYELKSSEYVF